MRQVLKFEVNQPVTVALDFPDGINVPGRYGPQVRYGLSGNRMMFVPPDVRDAIKQLGVKPGQDFTITKRVERGKRQWWDLARVKGGDAAETRGGGAGVPTALPRPSAMLNIPNQPQIAAQPASQPVSRDIPPRIQPHPATELPPPNRGMQLTRTPPVKLSYREAFRECLLIVQGELKAAGEQWSDSARQAAVSTMLIQYGRDGKLGSLTEVKEKAA